MKLIDALEIYLRQYTKAHTRYNYERVLRPLVEHLGTTISADRVRAIDLQEWVNNIHHQAIRFENHPRRKPEVGSLSPHTIYSRVKCIRAFFNWLVKMDVIPPEKNPVRNLKQKRLTRAVSDKRIATDAEIQRLTMVVYGHQRNYAMFLFMRDTACRSMEVAGLTLAKLHVDGLYAEVLGKGDIERDSFFGEECAHALRRWLLRRPIVEHDYVFCATRKPYAPLTPTAVSDMIERAAVAAGIERPLHAHHIRHWRATNLIQQNVDIPTVAAAIGDTIETTQAHYLHTSRERVQDAVRRTSFRLSAEETRGIIRLQDFSG
jgi:integrase/recombinase XerD